MCGLFFSTKKFPPAFVVKLVWWHWTFLAFASLWDFGFSSDLNESHVKRSILGCRLFPLISLNTIMLLPSGLRSFCWKVSWCPYGSFLISNLLFPVAFNILSLSSVFAIVITVCVVLFGVILFGTLCFLDLGDCSLSQVRQVFSFCVFRCILGPFLSSPSGFSIIWMLVWLLLSQWSQLPSFHSSFLFSGSDSFPLLSSAHGPVHLYHLSLPLIPSSVFSFQLLYSSSFGGYVFSFLRTSDFSLFIYSYSQFFSHLYDHDLELCLCFTLGLYLSSGMKCSSVTSFYLTYCVYFCVLGRLVMLPDFGEVAFGRGCPSVWVFLLWQADHWGLSGRCGWPLVWWVARPCLVQRQLTTGWQVDHEAVELCEAHPGAGAGSLEPGIGSRRFWSWSCPLVAEARSWNLASGPWGPRTGVRPLVGMVSSWHSWLQGLGCLFFFLNLCWVLVAAWRILVVACKLLIVPCKLYFSDQGLNPGPLYLECGVLATGPPGKSWVGVSWNWVYLLVGGAWAHLVQGLVLACWGVGCGCPEVGEAGPQAGAGSLVSGLGLRGVWGWCLPTGGQSWVPGWSGLLSLHRGLALWQAGLCPGWLWARGS